METQSNQQEPIKGNNSKKTKEKTVRGSGFTYSEKEQPTDRSIPIAQADEAEIVPLPDLGQPNRP